MNKYINRIDKLSIYDYYHILIEGCKEYEKITRAKMVNVMTEVLLDDPTLLEYYLTIQEIRDFQEVGFETIDLMNGKFIVFSVLNDNDELVFNDEFKKLIMAIEVDDELIEMNEYMNFIMGFVLVHGAFEVANIDPLYNKIRRPQYINSPKIKYEEIPLLLKRNLTTKGYINIQDVLVHNRYLAVNEGKGGVLEIHYPTMNYVYSLDEYLRFQENCSFDETTGNEDVLEIFMRKSVFILIQLDDENEYLLDVFDRVQNEELSEKELRHSITVLNFPLWELDGMSYLEFMEREFSAHIDEDKAFDYIQFLDHFVYYVNKKYRYYGRFSSIPEMYKGMDDMEAFEVLKKGIAKPKIIDSFIMSKNYPKSDSVEEFCNALRSARYIENGLGDLNSEGLLEVLHEGINYEITGITENIEDVVGGNLPAPMSLVVFPLENCLTYGISLLRLQMDLGPNIRSLYLKESKQAPKITNINDLTRLNRFH